MLEKMCWNQPQARMDADAVRANIGDAGKEFLVQEIDCLWVFPKIKVPPNHNFLLGFPL